MGFGGFGFEGREERGNPRGKLGAELVEDPSGFHPSKWDSDTDCAFAMGTNGHERSV